MDDQGTDSLDGIQVDDGPSTSSATVCADGEGSTEEVCPIPESVSEVEVEATASEEDSDLLKPPVLEPEEPLPNEADPSPHGDNPENTIVISSEDLAEAGLDMDNLNDLTNEQVAMLMEIAERRVQREMEAAQRSVESQQAMEEVVEEQYEGDGVQINNEALTMVITDDGSLKLTDACNQTFFFSAEQLGTMNIDVNNLTDESIQQIVQVAMPVIQVGKPREPTAEEHQALYDHDVNGVQPSGSGLKSGFVRASQLIGEQIEVRRNGKVATATIRYVRNGGAFKVQFDDGHFEWVTEDQIVIRTSRTYTDHEGYHNGSSAAVPRVVHASSMAGLKRAAAAAGGGCREVKRPNMEPNFCCPICENKVYQKEPAYIVIRIPACDSCTREKIIVLDDGAEGDDDRAVL